MGRVKIDIPKMEVFNRSIETLWIDFLNLEELWNFVIIHCKKKKVIWESYVKIKKRVKFLSFGKNRIFESSRKFDQSIILYAKINKKV